MIIIFEIDKQSGLSQHSYASSRHLAKLYLTSNGYCERDGGWVLEKDGQVMASIVEDNECTITVPNPRFTQIRALRGGWI